MPELPGEAAPSSSEKNGSRSAKWVKAMDGHRAFLQKFPKKLDAFAERLKLPRQVLERLDIGFFYHNNVDAIIWNEYEGSQKVCGQAFRTISGEKRAVTGSFRGFFLPPGWDCAGDLMYVAEGMSDAASLIAAGLNAIARPSKTSNCGKGLASLIEKSECRTVVILADRDDKEECQSADKLAAVLKDCLPHHNVSWAVSPQGSKDVREWMVARSEPWESRGDSFSLAIALRPPSPKAIKAVQKSKEPKQADNKGKPSTSDDGEDEVQSNAELMLDVINSVSYWHDDSTPYGTDMAGVSYELESDEFANYLRNTFLDFSDGEKAPSEALVVNGVKIAVAKAMKSEIEQKAFVRVGSRGDKRFLHLADKKNRIIEIGGDGWGDLLSNDDLPFKMIRKTHMRPLSRPTRGGHISELQGYFNVPGAYLFPLLKAWISSCFLPDGPYPLLVVSGEQGSSKSSFMRNLKALIDPSVCDSRKPPKDSRDLMIAAKGGHILAYDNLSGIPEWFSDDLCRLSTGGAVSTRSLYTNSGETILKAKSPVIINGIGDICGRADLLERVVMIQLPRLQARRTERELAKEFTEAVPRLLGGILDYVSGGLRELPNGESGNEFRMMDFVQFALACERAEGCKPVFLDAYRQSLLGGNEHVLESSPIFEPLMAVIRLAKTNSWEGTATALLGMLRDQLGTDHEPRNWPKIPAGLTTMLKRLSPVLKTLYDIDIEFDSKGRGGEKRRATRITWPAGLAKEDRKRQFERSSAY